MYFCLYFDIFICRFKNCWTVFALSVYSEAAIFVLVGQLLSSICQVGQFSGQFCNSQLSQCGYATCVHSINILQLHSVQLSACCPTLSGRQSQLMGIPCHQKGFNKCRANIGCFFWTHQRNYCMCILLLSLTSIDFGNLGCCSLHPQGLEEWSLQICWDLDDLPTRRNLISQKAQSAQQNVLFVSRIRVFVSDLYKGRTNFKKKKSIGVPFPCFS